MVRQHRRRGVDPRLDLGLPIIETFHIFALTLLFGTILVVVFDYSGPVRSVSRSHG